MLSAELDISAPAATGKPPAPAAARKEERGSRSVPGLGSGWISYAELQTGVTVSTFATSWTVPPNPAAQSGQVIYIFNGMWHPGFILQPVLQWGKDRNGGGPYWSVASWYQGLLEDGPSFHTSFVRVSPGDLLVGVMTLMSQGDIGGPGQAIRGVGSSAGPALAVNGGVLYMAWKGVGDDGGIYYSQLGPGGWKAQQNVPNVGTSATPALASFGGALNMAWMGIGNGGGAGIYWTTFVAGIWAPQQLIQAVRTDAGPALATTGPVTKQVLNMAWRGTGDDQGIYWATGPGFNYSCEFQGIPATRLTISEQDQFGTLGEVLECYGINQCADYPAAADVRMLRINVQFPAGTDLSQLQWSVMDQVRDCGQHTIIVNNSTVDGEVDNYFTAQERIVGVGTSASPALALYNGVLTMAWKGVGDDGGIYYSQLGPGGWKAQQHVPGVGTSTGPALVEYNGSLYKAWKGHNDDSGIYWSQLGPGGWKPQQNVPNVGTSASPALALYNGVMRR